MEIARERGMDLPKTHPWLRRLELSYVSGVENPLLDKVAERLLATLSELGHTVEAVPTPSTEVLLTSADFMEPMSWRKAAIFNARRQFGLKQTPTIYTLVHATPDQFHDLLRRLEQALEKDPPVPADFEFPGLAPDAYRVLVEQGHRGGPILAMERIIQAQTKSIRILLIVGDSKPLEAYSFDLVGAHPRTVAEDPDRFYQELALRMVTSESTCEITDHATVGPDIPRAEWERARTPEAMLRAARELDARSFFTEMVRIADLVQVPAIEEAVSSQYSEGCFSTWDYDLEALVATVTGSARPVDKGNITEDDLAVIVGLKPDASGALVRHVEGKGNDPPSSEAVEMIDMDTALPQIDLDDHWPARAKVPMVRSKLHGHRGVAGFNPERVEHVHLDETYYHYLVSCSTEAQAHAIKAAFAHSEALRDLDDPRTIVFTVLPGHGVMIVEKWVKNKEPFQEIWEAFDARDLVIENSIPQGPFEYIPTEDGRMSLKVL